MGSTTSQVSMNLGPASWSCRRISRLFSRAGDENEATDPASMNAVEGIHRLLTNGTVNGTMYCGVNKLA